MINLLTAGGWCGGSSASPVLVVLIAAIGYDSLRHATTPPTRGRDLSFAIPQRKASELLA